MEHVKALALAGQNVFEWKLRRTIPQQDTTDSDEHKIRLKTKSKPVLATGFASGVSKIVDHLFDWTEQALCANGSNDTAPEHSHSHPHGHAHGHGYAHGHAEAKVDPIIAHANAVCQWMTEERDLPLQTARAACIALKDSPVPSSQWVSFLKSLYE